MNVTTGQVLKYTLLPGILPRIRDFFSSGFTYLAFYVAQVYRVINLLPSDHPYLQHRNVGRYGIRHVVFEAKRNLVFKWENIDQIIMFFLMLMGMVLLLVQFGMTIFGFLVPLASAASGAGSPGYLASFFVTPNPTYDIAYRLLDATFGFNGTFVIFNSCLAQGVQCQLAFNPGGGFAPVGPVFTVPTGFHNGLHLLFEFYNIGVLAIGFAVFLYLVVAIVAETAQSGTPFGKRFNGAWVPIRLFIAIALLTPLDYGMNGAQLLTLAVSKWGSSLATNGWDGFIGNLAGETLAGQPTQLVVTPDPPEMNAVVEYVFIALTCKHTENYLEQRTVEAYHVFGPGAGGSNPFVGKTFLAALADANNQDIQIRFGVKDPNRYAGRYKGAVKPVCGELTLTTKDIAQAGAMVMQEGYFTLLQNMWTHAQMDLYSENVVLRHIPTDAKQPNINPIPDTAFITSTNQFFATDVPALVTNAVNAQIASNGWIENHASLGWAGAAIWYNKIAEMNGGLFASVYAPPTPGIYTEAMEHVLEQRRMQDDFINAEDRYNPILSSGDMVEFDSEMQMHKAIIHHKSSKYWTDLYPPLPKNPFIDTIVAIFGLEGLYNMTENLNIHPLAQLVGVGRSLIESAITNLGFSFGAGAVGGIAGIVGGDMIQSLAYSAASFAGKVATIGLTLGFILYYIVPFLPFIYFFFAVGGWIKSIYEAMVGLPLWAIAHIRIDGDGLPGPAAMNGYFLIFEIFIRPILIIFGLVAAVSVFAAQVEVLNEIWKLVVSNLVGYNPNAAPYAPVIPVDNNWGANIGSTQYLRDHIDRLFHTVIYTIIVYMMAMASFKLIDLVPNNILRWMGTSVSTFQEQADDPAQGLVKYAYFGANGALGGLSGGFKSLLMRSS